jgi:hypothetical protein
MAYSSQNLRKQRYTIQISVGFNLGVKFAPFSWLDLFDFIKSISPLNLIQSSCMSRATFSWPKYLSPLQFG